MKYGSMVQWHPTTPRGTQQHPVKPNNTQWHPTTPSGEEYWLAHQAHSKRHAHKCFGSAPHKHQFFCSPVPQETKSRSAGAKKKLMMLISVEFFVVAFSGWWGILVFAACFAAAWLLVKDGFLFKDVLSCQGCSCQGWLQGPSLFFRICVTDANLFC